MEKHLNACAVCITQNLSTKTEKMIAVLVFGAVSKQSTVSKTLLGEGSLGSLTCKIYQDLDKWIIKQDEFVSLTPKN